MFCKMALRVLMVVKLIMARPRLTMVSDHGLHHGQGQWFAMVRDCLTAIKNRGAF